MLTVLSPIDFFENDDDLYENIIRQCRDASEDNPDFSARDFLKGGNLFPDEEFIYDSASGKCIPANDYVEALVHKKTDLKI